MATANFNLPEIDENNTADVPRDHNALALAVDQALFNVKQYTDEQITDIDLSDIPSIEKQAAWDAKPTTQQAQAMADAALNAAKAASIPRAIPDERGSTTLPTDYSNIVRFRFKANGDVGLPASAGSYVVICGIKGWHDDSGGLTTEIAYGNDGLYRRTGSSDNTSWNPWVRMIDSGGGVFVNTVEFNSPVPMVMTSPSPTGKSIVFHRSSEEGLKNRLYIGLESAPKQGNWDFAKGMVITEDDILLPARGINVGADIANLKSSVSNGKAAVAAAITDKGIPTAATAEFATMANNIRGIRPPSEYKQFAAGSLTITGSDRGAVYVTPTLSFAPHVFIVKFRVNFGGGTSTERAVFLAPLFATLGSDETIIAQKGKAATPVELRYEFTANVGRVRQISSTSTNYILNENPTFEAYGV